MEDVKFKELVAMKRFVEVIAIVKEVNIVKALRW